MNEVTAKTGLVCLLGTPIKHSFSPTMHNCAFAELGIDNIYLAFDVDQNHLRTAVEGLKALQFVGCNVTMPNKVAIIPYLDEISPASQLTGSVNTVVNRNGKLYGTITDGVGYMEALKDRGFDILGKKIVLLGSGGAATAVAIQAALDGVAEISMFARKDEFYHRGEETARKINEKTACKASLHDLADTELLRKELAESVLLANCTPLGMKPLLGMSPITDPTLLRPDLIVTDVIYSPAKTPLLEMAEQVGCPTMNGLGMMLFQGAASFKLWTGQEMPIDKVKETLHF